MRLNGFVLLIFFIAIEIKFYAQIFEETNVPLPNLNLPQPAPATPTSNAEIDRIISIVNTVESKNKFIDQLNPDSNVSLPFGIIKQKGAVRYVIAIDSMKFLPAGAYFSAYAAIDFPGSINKLAIAPGYVKQKN